MRARLCLGWLVCAILVAGCDTNQPLRQEQQTIGLSFNAINAVVQAMSTWTVFEDSDGDFSPDDVNGDGVPDTFLWCDPQPFYVTSRMPWSYSVQVDKVLAGEVENITVARETEANRSFATYDPSVGQNNLEDKSPLEVTNRTGYCFFNRDILCNPDNPSTTACTDEDAGSCRAAGVCSGDASVDCEPDDASSTLCESMGLGTCSNVPVTRTFRYVPQRILLSGANRSTLAAPENIVFITDPTAALNRGPTGGICPGSDLGDANAGGNSLPWTFEISKGDTVHVQARRFNLIPDGFLVGPMIPPISPDVVYINLPADPISAEMSVNGAPAATIGVSATTTGDPESFIDFFFTSR